MGLVILNFSFFISSVAVFVSVHVHRGNRLIGTRSMFVLLDGTEIRAGGGTWQYLAYELRKVYCILSQGDA